MVLCSRSSASSRWVDAEIEHFLDAGREADIITVLVDGEPATADERAAAATDGNLPPALRRLSAEPLAVDLRGAESGAVPRDAVLRLVSAVLGCGFDELYQRDRRRRRKQRTLAMAYTLAALLALGGGSGWFLGRIVSSDALAAAEDALRRGDKGGAQRALARAAIVPEAFLTEHDAQRRGLLGERLRFVRASDSRQVVALGDRTETYQADLPARGPGWAAETIRSSGYSDEARYAIRFRTLADGEVRYVSDETRDMPSDLSVSPSAAFALVRYHEPSRVSLLDLGRERAAAELTVGDDATLLPGAAGVLARTGSKLTLTAVLDSPDGPAFAAPIEIGGEPLATIRSPSGSVTVVVFPDGGVEVLDGSGRLDTSVSIPPAAAPRLVVGWNADDTRLALSLDGRRFAILDVSGGEVQSIGAVESPHRLLRVALLDDTTLLGVEQGAGSLYRGAPGERGGRFTDLDGVSVTGVFGIGGKDLAVLQILNSGLHVATLLDDGRFELVYLDSARLRAVRLSRETGAAALGLDSGRVVALDAGTGAWLVDERPFSEEVQGLRFESRGRVVSAVDGGGAAATFELHPEALAGAARVEVGPAPRPSFGGRECGAFRLSPDGAWAFVQGKRALGFVSLLGRRAALRLDPPRYSRRWRMSFSPDGAYAALLVEREGVVIYRLSTGAPVLSSDAWLPQALFRDGPCGDPAGGSFAWLPGDGASDDGGRGPAAALVRLVGGGTELVATGLPEGTSLVIERPFEIGAEPRVHAVDVNGASGFLFHDDGVAIPVVRKGGAFEELQPFTTAEGEEILTALGDVLVIGSPTGLTLRRIGDWEVVESHRFDASFEARLFTEEARSSGAVLLAARGEDFGTDLVHLAVRGGGARRPDEARLVVPPLEDGRSLDEWTLSDSGRYLAAVDRDALEVITVDLGGGGGGVRRLALGAYPRHALVAGTVAAGIGGGGSELTRVLIGDASDGRELLRLARELSDAGAGITLSPDGRYVVVSSMGDAEDDASRTLASAADGLGAFARDAYLGASLVDLRSGTEIVDLAETHIRPHLRSTALGVREVAFARDGELLGTLGYDGSVRLWEVAGPAER